MHCSSIYIFFSSYFPQSPLTRSLSKETPDLFATRFRPPPHPSPGTTIIVAIRERAAHRGAVAWSVGDYGVVVSFRPMEEGKRRDGGGEVGDDGWWW
ncbi:hypothetical protein QL285_067192 [Trifolium repens]|nr:hypothetical protein QL285_067192 [Trifolium repens]